MSLSLVPPEEVTDLVPFRPTVPGITWRLGQPDDSVTGRISQCGTEVTLCRDSHVRLHQSQTGWLCAELCLRRREQLLAGPFVHFRCAQRDFMAVAVRGAARGLPSLLCIFHPPSNRVVRAVHLPAPATHLAVVSGDELGRRTGGWLAVATKDRWLMLLGLCMDSVQHHADGTKPLGVVAVERKGFFSDDDALGLPPAHLERGPLHPCVQFCGVQSLIEEGEMPIVDGDAKVTCLEWLPQLGCLGFGLSCGTVHVWDVVALTPVFTVNLPSDLPVVALAVQEPENDPRCCCYLWVAQGATTVRSATGLSCCSVASMHSVTYGSKEPGQDGRCVYKEFRHTRQVFEYPLEPRVVGNADSGLQPAADSGPLGSRIISFRTAPPPLGPRRGERTEDNPGVLLLLSWQLVRGDQVVGSYLSVFDMNQWHRAHMPQAFWLNAQQLCPYMGLFSLGEVVAKCGGLPLLDVWVPPSSVKKYRSPDPLVEQAHFPSSLAFSCICLTAEGTVHASFLGMQRQLLHEINLGGLKCLNDATNLCARLFRVGLIDDSIGLPVLQQSPAAARGMLLDVALEHRMVGFLVACLWGDTRTTSNPADWPLLSFVLNWTWAKVTEVKTFLDELYVPLFDCSGQDVSEVVQHMAIHLEELSILHRLLEHACGMETGHPELVGVRCDAVRLLATHLQALLFLVHCEVLPDNHVATGLISYPYATLRASCLQARKDLGGTLLVDVLIEATLAKRKGAAAAPSVGWKEYPPPSLQQATDVYLRRGLQPWAPHALTYYLLLDLSAVFVEEHPAVQEKVERFLDVLSMGVDVQALVQGIWSLDHGSYREGLEHLQRAHSLAAPGLRPVLSALWGPAVRLLLGQGQASLAALGLGCLPAPSTREELTLQLDVLLANSRVIDALELVRKHGEFAGMDQLLGSLVAVAKRIGLRSAQQQLETLLQSPLEASEEEQLRGFFGELADPVWLSQAALHYLQCGQPRSALPLTTSLHEIFHEGRAQQPQQQQRPYPALVRKRATATVELMQSFLRIVPSAASKQDLPVHLLEGTALAQRQRRGTTLRLVPGGDATGPSTKLPGYRASALPRSPSEPTTDEQRSASSSFSEERRRSLLNRLEAEALSILHIPVVRPWQPRARAESDAAVPASLTTPPSMLKRRAVAVPPLASTPTPMEEGDTPPTPPLVDGIVPTSAKPPRRRLRFSISDSSLSETGQVVNSPCGIWAHQLMLADHDSSTATTCSLELDHSRRNSEGMTSFTQDGAAADTEDDLDGTPLMDEEEDGSGSDETPPRDNRGGDLEANCERGLHAALYETDAFEGALPILAKEEEGTKHSVAQTEAVILPGTEESTVTSPVALGSDPCGAAVEQVPDRSSEEELVMPRPMPEFAASGPGGEAGLVEQVTEASASEAFDSGKSEDEDDDDAVALSEKSEALPNPDSTEIQEADRSRSPVATNDSDREEGCVEMESSVSEGTNASRKGDGNLEGCTDVGAGINESDKVVTEVEEPLETVREPSLGFLSTPVHVEAVDMEQPLLDEGSAARILLRENSPPEALADQKPSGASVAEIHSEGNADSVPALDQSAIQDVESDVEETAAAVVEAEPLPAARMLLPKIVVTCFDSSPPLSKPSNVEGSGVTARKLFSPPTNPKHSPPKKGGLDLKRKKSLKREGASLVEDLGEPSSSSQSILTCRYNLRERRKSTVDGKESHTAEQTRRSLRRGGSAPPSDRPPVTPAKARAGSSDLKEGAKEPASKARKARAASEEPMSTHSRETHQCCSPLGKVSKLRALRKSATPSPIRKTPNTRERTQTPSPKRESRTPSPERTDAPRHSKRASTTSRRLAMPDPSKKSATPSPRRKTPNTRERTQTPSPRRESRTPSPERTDAPRHSKRASTTSRRLAMPSPSRKSATPSPSRKTANTRERTQTPSQRRDSRTPSPERTDAPRHSKRASTVSRRLTVPSPSRKSATPSPRRKKPTSRETTRTPSPKRKARTPTPERGAGNLSPTRSDAPGRPKKASAVRKRLATPSPTKQSATQSRKKAATTPPARKRAATRTPSKQPPASPAKTPTRRSRATVATTSHEVEDPSSQNTESQSATVSAGQKRAAAQDARTQSPTRKAVRKGTRGQQCTTTDTDQAELATGSSTADKSPAKDRRSEAGALASPDGQQKAPSTRARHQIFEKRVATPSKPTGPTRSTSAGTSKAGSKTGSASLGAIAEVDDDVFVEGDGEVAGPSTGARPEGPTGTVGMQLRSASHKLLSGTALSSIAEVPAAGGGVTTPARRGQGKCKASEEAGETSEEAEQGAAAMPSPAKGQAPLRKKGKKPADPTAAGTSTAPLASSVRAKPTTRSRRQQKRATVAANESSSSPSSEEDVPET
ncbi:uncharacterized protein LOC144141292 [Haemaphysalis longicornis]